MQRLLIAAAAVALLATSVAPAFADDEYPPCRTRDQDHCREVPLNSDHHRHHGHDHHHPHH